MFYMSAEPVKLSLTLLSSLAALTILALPKK
jgi:hypothetical protein